MRPTPTEADGTPRVALIRPGGRYRGLKAVLKLLLGAAIAATLLAGTAHTLRTWALPAAPEPFDAAAFRATTIPDDRNAYIPFAEARDLLRRSQDPSWPVQSSRSDEWAHAGPEMKAWVETNRPAMEAWRRGTDRPDALAPPVGEGLNERSSMAVDLWYWLRGALLEAGRHEEAGDPSAAWAWHRARLRAPLLVARRGSFFDRRSSSFFLNGAIARAQGWADRDDATVPALRRAIADVEAMAPLIASDADAVKVLYLYVMGELDQATRLHFMDEATRAAAVPAPTAPGPAPLVQPAARVDAPGPLRAPAWWLGDYLSAEPERSRRAVRLIVANWLAQAEKPTHARTAAVADDPLLFEPDPGTSLPLAPAELSAYANAAPLLSILRGQRLPSLFPNRFFDQWPSILDGDRRALGRLIVGLAGRIYELENGKVPSGPEQLVPSVLPRLPDSYVPPDVDESPALPEPTPPNPRR